MNIEKYQEEVKRTVNPELDKENRLHNFVYGLNGEVGELTDYLKKIIFHSHSKNDNELKKEIGDICWYIANLCNEFEFDLKEILQLNIDKLYNRYPKGFTKENSIKRNNNEESF